MKNTINLTGKEALRIVNTIVGELEARGKHAAVAVADSHGELLAFIRTEKVKLTSVNIVINKAYTAARAQRKTSQMGDNARNSETGFEMSWYGDPRLTGFGGGIPVVMNGEVAGAVAVSGLSTEEDEELAQLGISSLDITS